MFGWEEGRARKGEAVAGPDLNYPKLRFGGVLKVFRKRYPVFGVPRFYPPFFPPPKPGLGVPGPLWVFRGKKKFFKRGVPGGEKTPGDPFFFRV